MGNDIKAIETRYRGYRFRSRLEARWAVFFDALGIRWEYEPEGFDLGDAGWYLPDFWLPDFCGRGMYVEVKPTNGDFGKACQFCKLSNNPVSVWFAEGAPAIRSYVVWETDGHYPDEDGITKTIGIPNADQAEGENRMYWCPGYENDDLSIPNEYHEFLGDTFLLAVVAARSARFEHGEQPFGS